ncbi:hypothetical protein WISP_29000 [Willisornis vidua]|uniref:Uncharacterized protein n=1 Tax=Willisornis vidua TaxID=1566151 RepID=A0ABQ9DKR1_9PASS|nr:hypothetical protein WISP_29000 [Willisornis vidua]
MGCSSMTSMTCKATPAHQDVVDQQRPVTPVAGKEQWTGRTWSSPDLWLFQKPLLHCRISMHVSLSAPANLLALNSTSFTYCKDERTKGEHQEMLEIEESGEGKDVGGRKMKDYFKAFHTEENIISSPATGLGEENITSSPVTGLSEQNLISFPATGLGEENIIS